jgi:hypothetical protein
LVVSALNSPVYRLRVVFIAVHPYVRDSLASCPENRHHLTEHLRATLQVDEGAESAGGEFDLLVERHNRVEIRIDLPFGARLPSPDSG